ncbi:hypothetical protein HDG32_005457 [Paraburkholderia sp. CI2]|uniref:DUF4279 domain-containing protein n=1 Tax=Paraburkholderia sp. CI2 TaxID=2723093 RepID=UPI00161CF2E1|nr:DUF4279 domain-containing protein [Paraburkholderia sp. CI2]MBB5469310.1 hypothetical protein [Paraburkholderia sp. CI2]
MSVHQLAHATFSISGEYVVPGFWRKYFAVVPDVAIAKGDPVVDPTRQGRVVTRRTGVWSVRSKEVVRSDLLEPHLRYLVSHLNLSRDDFQRLLADKNAKVRFFCYWYNASGDRVSDVPTDIRIMMEAMGGTVEIDEYR